MNRMWEIFWAASGEQLIWLSWIEKFGEFINPEYSSSNVVTDKPAGERPSDFKTNHTETEIRISSCSPAAHPEVNYNSADHLLSPRCESVTSSIPITIATTDSMTNVTHLTLSSGDFGQTTGGMNQLQSESESINSSEMLTSSSSNSSQSPEDELLNAEEAEAKVLADLCHSGNGCDDAMDSDQHWQILWQKHFQEQYTEQYRQFMESKRAEAQSGSSVPESSFDEVPVAQSTSSCRSSRKQRRIAKVDLPELVSGLNIAENYVETTVEAYDGEDYDKDNVNGQPPEEVNNAEVNVMASMGLPTSFGSSKQGNGGDGGDGNRNPNEKNVTLKRR